MNTKLIPIALFLIVPLTVSAFSGGEGKGSQGKQANKIERLAQKLDLSSEQKTKIEAIFKLQREKIDAIKEDSRTRMQAILTPTQMNEFNALKARRQEKKQNRQNNKMNNKQKRMNN